ncbi:MAG: TadE/TadG family type IV pilus assembly protein [Sandaracinaceae bacterium]
MKLLPPPQMQLRLLGREPAADQAFVHDQSGAAYVEFLISFLPLFFLFTGMVQMALMYGADLVVQHSASQAARAASVVLDDDPERYDGQQRRSVQDSSGGEATSAQRVATFIAGSVPGMGAGSVPGGARMGAIRSAASVPLMAVSPSLTQLMGGARESIGVALGDARERGAVAAGQYNRSAMGVTFPTSPGASSFRDTFPAGQNVQVTTRVTYLFNCGVPLANRLMCETYASLQLGPVAGLAEGVIADLSSGRINYDDAMARLERIDVTRRRHDRDSPALDEIESSAASGSLYLTGATGARFKVLRGEATMPLQYAGYRYPSE